MKQLLANKRILIGALLFVFVVFLGSGVYMKLERDTYAGILRMKVAEQQTTLTTIEELTNREGADAVVSRIIQDCSLQNRQRFDSLMDNLAELRGNELQETDQLFDLCGNYFAQRKAVMVAKLEREFEVYRDLVQMLKVVDKKADFVTIDIDGWSQLIALEKERSELSSKIVVVQKEIITGLVNGESAASESMQLKLVEGHQTRDKLREVSTEVTTLRSSLLDV